VIVLCCHESLLRRHCIERDLFGRYLGGLSPGGGVGTILCGSNTTTEDFARWVLGTAEPSRVAPAELHQRSVGMTTAAAGATDQDV
jgi:hypothetical protein